MSSSKKNSGEKAEMTNIEELIEQHGDAIYRFCCSVSDNLFEAEELFQDTFLKIMEVWEKVAAAENPKSYVIGIAVKLNKNKQRKFLRRRALTPEALVFDREERKCDVLDAIAADEKSILEQLVEKEQIKKLRECLRDMDLASRTLIALYYGEGLSIKEIAKLMKLPEGTVKSRLYKIRQNLRASLEEE